METREERLERRRREKAEQVAYKLEREIAIWDPQTLKSCTEDPFKTLFVARIVSLVITLSFIVIIHFFFLIRITIRPSPSYVVNLKCTARLRKFLSSAIQKHRSPVDTPLLSMNMSVICTVSNASNCDNG